MRKRQRKKNAKNLIKKQEALGRWTQALNSGFDMWFDMNEERLNRASTVLRQWAINRERMFGDSLDEYDNDDDSAGARLRNLLRSEGV